MKFPPRLSSIFLAAMALAGCFLVSPAHAHKVSAVSVVAEFDTKAKTFKVELAMDVDPTGDPAIDDQVPPEKAAYSFATEALKIYFDDTPMTIEPTIRLVTTSDKDTPQELVRKAVIGTLAGKIPEEAENFLLHVNENTEAAVVMVTNKDGKPARRLQVLYPGEFSNPVSLAPVIEGDPFKESSQKGNEAQSAGTPASKEAEPSAKVPFHSWIGRGFSAVIPKGAEFWAFTFALFLLSLRSRPLGWQVGAYAVAHSIALSLSAFKLVDLPMNLVLPIVAISAAYPAIENLFVSELKPWRPVLIFVLGIFHGFAFGQILWSHDPVTLELPLAVAGFNLGIELAQFALLVLASLIAVALSRKPWFRHGIAIPLCVIVAGIAIYRFIEVTWLS
ncbi:MAG: HupE/UreJ family protein [Verrucomicrobiae bacterium]|nr:HupE/UreJ family protein [Verrucomicrobiae bacterium]